VVLGGGCVVPGGEPGKISDDPLAEGQGQIVLTWKPEDADRALLGSGWATATADLYELVLLGSTNRSVELTSGSSQILSVDPGTWRVVVLAGVKRTSGSTTAFLVGSATAESVVVNPGQRTAVDLVLKSLDLGLAATGPAYWKGTVPLSLSGKSRNARVGMLLAGASTTSRPRLKSVELWNGYREVSSVSGTPDDWSAEASGTVPDGVGTLTIGLVGAGLCVQDAGGAWVPTAGLTKSSWFWPNRADVADTHPLASLTELSVPTGPPPTGLTVALTWE